ncbi:alpha/beta-hydrolase [Myriangium duriaei CBS 260.36]|uniref:Alpha/beta-hydrolase n=1 Tax=Myriangium duriaei CBS 260.36 TaxID=1168546 RepID=A0A9P4MND3_9PEZI|nr:alpha/beta-hydrolase [Myriangium duriaei CBS 260.36]
MRTNALLLLGLSSVAVSVPAPGPAVTSPEAGDLTSDLLGDLLSDIQGAIALGNPNGVVSALKSATPTATPTATSAASAALQSIVQTATNGLLSESVNSLASSFLGEFTAENSETNNNPAPPLTIYPKKLSCDAPYSVSEQSLRSAIYIPSTFTHGQKPPVILFPGTGNHGYETFSANFIKLLSGSNWADPVWVNVPNRLLDDAQKNAEYAAYALNYIASVTGRNTTIVTWSQGNIDVQWAVKYWPSTRKTTSDHVGISADYKGTAFADFICPDGLASCNPSVYQQQYLGDSKFITALRANGGDSGYVPTTSIYSGLYDEIVEPQQGTGASAYLNDARSIGVTNNEAQTVCAGQVAGSFYTHEGMLFNPLSLALLKDAMANDGPGRPERLDLKSVCSTYLAPGLNLGDFLGTENALLIAGLGVLLGQPRTTMEPSLQSYAASSGQTCAS